jgi:hypothetical protein
MNKKGKKINGINYIIMDLLLVKSGFKHNYLILTKIKNLNKSNKFWYKMINGLHIAKKNLFCSKK